MKIEEIYKKEISQNDIPNTDEGCYKDLLPKTNKRSKSVLQKPRRMMPPREKKTLLELMVEYDPKIQKLMKLNEEVAEFRKEVYEENVYRKKDKYIETIFQPEKEEIIDTAPRSIRTTNLFRDTDIEETPAYFEYQMLNKIRKDNKSLIGKYKEDRRKKVYQPLPWGKGVPKIIVKGGSKTIENIIEKSPIKENESPRFENGFNTNRKTQEDTIVLEDRQIIAQKARKELKLIKERKEFEEKLKDCLTNPIFKTQFDVTDIKSMQKYMPKMELMNYVNLND